MIELDKEMDNRYMYVSRKIIVIAVSMLLISITGCSNPQKANYEMQEKCAKDAAQYFANNYAVASRYENHYNTKLNKCFIKVVNPSYAHTDNFHLIDINENKLVGCYFIYPGLSKTNVACDVAGTKCQSLDQWNVLAKKYMEE